MNLKPNGRIWIDTEQGAFMGYGRIELLEKILNFSNQYYYSYIGGANAGAYYYISLTCNVN